MASITMEVGKYIESTDYVEGESGFRINGDGTFEFNGGVFRGTVTLEDSLYFLRLTVGDVLRGLVRPGIVFPELPGHVAPVGPYSGAEIVAVGEDGETEGVRMVFVKDVAGNVSGVYISGGDLSTYGNILAKSLSVSSTDVAGYPSGPFTLYDLFEIAEAAPATGGTVMRLRCNIGGTQRYLPVQVDGSGYLHVTP